MAVYVHTYTRTHVQITEQYVPMGSITIRAYGIIVLHHASLAAGVSHKRLISSVIREIPRVRSPPNYCRVFSVFIIKIITPSGHVLVHTAACRHGASVIINFRVYSYVFAAAAAVVFTWQQDPGGAP